MERTGRCLRRRVKWQSDAPDNWTGHCHCDSCRRASSAPFTSFFDVPRDSVTWVGEIATYQSSQDVMRGYCGKCGSQLYYQTTRWPDETHLYASTLDDAEAIRPQAHYHYAEKLPWVAISDDLIKHAGSTEAN